MAHRPKFRGARSLPPGRKDGSLLAPARRVPQVMETYPTTSEGSPRRQTVPTYISLLRYTQQGIAAIKQGPYPAGRREAGVQEGGW